MKKHLTLLLSIMMVATLLSGCGNKATVSNDNKGTESKTTLKGTITFANNKTDINDTKITDLANQFMKLNPDVKVICEGLSDPNAVLKTRAAANELPDITIVPSSITKADYENYFLPLDDLGYTKDKIEFYSEGLGTDGKQYSITNAINLSGVFVYNKKVLADAGVTSFPKTWEELWAACEKVKSKGVIPIVTGFKDGWCIDPWLFAAADSISGQNYLLKVLQTKSTPFAEGGEMLNTVKALKTAYSKGYLEKDLMSSTFDGTKKALASGEAGMELMASWLPSQVVELGAASSDISMAPVPGAKGIFKSGDIWWGIAKNTKSPEAAKAFLKFLWDDGKYANVCGQASSLISVKGAVPGLEDLKASGATFLTYQEVDPKIADQLTSVKNKSEIDFVKVLQEYILTKGNPDDVLNKANVKWTSAYKAVIGQK